ncbi:LLM class flavin-dependent oxidoreductase [Bradyrhizobium diazoefficiens]|nr:LLM class flavin-dependent oxidoreductase [Bradyrhizobium diazoefficiens]
MLQSGETGTASRAAMALRPETARPDLASQIAFCRQAEDLGFAGLLIDIGATKPDPIVLASALGLKTRSIEFIVACRSGLQSPAVFVQQINTLSALSGGRVILNVVAGYSPAEQRYYGDFLDHGERYQRTAEFLEVCEAFWRHDKRVNYNGRYYRVENGELGSTFESQRRHRPELLIAGGSAPARDLAMAHGDCWMRLPEAPATLEAAARPVLAAGKTLGLRLAIIGARKRSEALEMAHALRDSADRTVPDRSLEGNFIARSDSVSFKAMHDDAARVEWLTPALWTGLVPSHGAPAVALVGSADEIAAALIDFEHAGASQFILSGWPKAQSMEFFGQEILPRVRRLEKHLEIASPVPCSIPSVGMRRSV